MKKLLFVLAPEKFRETEFLAPKAFVEQAGIEALTVSSADTSTGTNGFIQKNDFLLNEVSPDDFDGIVFIGGTGSLDYMENEDAKNLTQAFIEEGKLVTAICAAPRLFLEWGILKGKKCTGHDWDNNLEKIVTDAGAHYVKEPVVVDGKFITAEGPLAADEFGVALVKALQ